MSIALCAINATNMVFKNILYGVLVIALLPLIMLGIVTSVLGLIFGDPYPLED